MQALLYPPSAPQSIGQVLDSGFRLFQVSLVRCLVYAALGMIAGQLAPIYAVLSGSPAESIVSGLFSGTYVLLYLLGAVLMLLFYALLIVRQHGMATGRPLPFNLELSETLRRMPAYLGMSLITILIIVASSMIVGIAYGIANAINGGLTVVGIIVAVVFIALVYLITPLATAGPAVLLDRKGPLEGIRYAFRLVSGNWWRTTSIYTVTAVVLIVFYFVGMVFAAFLLPVLGATDLAAFTAASAVMYIVLGSIGLPFGTAVVIATYGELKVRKEGLDLE
ncbi:MAG: hypothetical protein IRZ28_17860, partial [Steroidobacteraceae bacterium]|nr:hypothetical protein [Steroidobacteraceae bacterium]